MELHAAWVVHVGLVAYWYCLCLSSVRSAHVELFAPRKHPESVPAQRFLVTQAYRLLSTRTCVSRCITQSLPKTPRGFHGDDYLKVHGFLQLTCRISRFVFFNQHNSTSVPSIFSTDRTSWSPWRSLLHPCFSLAHHPWPCISLSRAAGSS